MGSYAWQSVAWTVGIFVFSVVVATRLYGRTAA